MSGFLMMGNALMPTKTIVINLFEQTKTAKTHTTYWHLGHGLKTKSIYKTNKIDNIDQCTDK